MTRRWPRTRARHGRRRLADWRASDDVAAAIAANRQGSAKAAAIRAYVKAMLESAAVEELRREVKSRIQVERHRIADWAWISGPPVSDELARLMAARRRLDNKRELWTLLAETAGAHAIMHGGTTRECEDAFERAAGQAGGALVRLHER